MSPRRHRLTRLARRLEPRPDRWPYFVSATPGPDGEPAIGWYFIPGNWDYPSFLGGNSVDAEIALRRMVGL